MAREPRHPMLHIKGAESALFPELHIKRFHFFRSHPHFTIADPHVRPAPNPAVAMILPACTFPLRTASSNARGMEAALVLP